MSKASYHSVPNNDDSKYEASPPSPRSSRSSILSSFLLGYSALTTVFIIVLILILLGSSRTDASQTKCPSQDAKLQRIYGMNFSYTSVAHQYDHLWSSFQVPIIQLPDDGFGGEPTPATFSMFHQLHCLASFRNAIQRAREGEDPGIDTFDNDHWPHCMDYLRSTILCWADDTVERRYVLPNGTILPSITGTDDVRQCGEPRRLVDVVRSQGKEVDDSVITELYPVVAKRISEIVT